MQAEHGTVSGAMISDEQRAAVNSARNCYELAAQLSGGVVTRPILRARLQELDDLEQRFSAKHPILFVVWNLINLAIGVTLFGVYESAAGAESPYNWANLNMAILFVLYGIVQLLFFAILRNPRRRERALIETLLFNKEVLPHEE